jgi:hypothetical protein
MYVNKAGHNRIKVCNEGSNSEIKACMYVCMYVCMYIRMYVCMHVELDKVISRECRKGTSDSF